MFQYVKASNKIKKTKKNVNLSQLTCSRHNLCITDSVANIVYEFNQQRVWNTSAILLIPTKTRNTNGEGRNTKSYLYGTIYTDTTSLPFLVKLSLNIFYYIKTHKILFTLLVDLVLTIQSLKCLWESNIYP